MPSGLQLLAWARSHTSFLQALWKAVQSGLCRSVCCACISPQHTKCKGLMCRAVDSLHALMFCGVVQAAHCS